MVCVKVVDIKSIHRMVFCINPYISTHKLTTYPVHWGRERTELSIVAGDPFNSLSLYTGL